jgi:DNA gyrase/topoisomerase IV subunit A
LNALDGSQIKRREVELALELTDIIDELNTINRLFEAQKDALDAAVKIFGNIGQNMAERVRYEPLKDKLSIIMTRDIEEYIKQVKRMTADAQRTKDNVSPWSVHHLFAEFQLRSK